MKDRPTLALALTLVLLSVFGALFAAPAHPEFPWHDLPGHMAVIGFGGCLAIAVFAKSLGKFLVQRPEERADAPDAERKGDGGDD